MYQAKAYSAQVNEATSRRHHLDALLRSELTNIFLW